MSSLSLKPQTQHQLQDYPLLEQADPTLQINHLEDKKCKARGPPKGSKRKPNNAAGIKSGFWNINQMKGYLRFIIRFQRNFANKTLRKKKKIFEKMSNYIKSRTAQQCRSHHQKLQQKLQDHQKIISFIKEEIMRQQNEEDLKQRGEEQIQIEIVGKTEEKQTNLKDNQKLYQINKNRGALVISLRVENLQSW